jgi:hypothetical protein
MFFGLSGSKSGPESAPGRAVPNPGLLFVSGIGLIVAPGWAKGRPKVPKVAKGCQKGSQMVPKGSQIEMFTSHLRSKSAVTYNKLKAFRIVSYHLKGGAIQRSHPLTSPWAGSDLLVVRGSTPVVACFRMFLHCFFSSFLAYLFSALLGFLMFLGLPFWCNFAAFCIGFPIHGFS